MADQIQIHGNGPNNIVSTARDIINSPTIINRPTTPEPDPIFFNVRSPDASFVGRLSELTRLENATSTSSNSSSGKHITVVSGLGGIGKTQLIRKFIEKYRSSYKNVIWIDSESAVTVMNSFKELADILTIPTTHPDGKEKDFEFIVELVVNKLSKMKTLMVYDNVDEIENVKLLLKVEVSGTKIDILITSRIKDWGGNIDVVQLKVWELDDAIAFVSTTLKDPESSHKDSDDDKQLLTKKLQSFPLALKQATAHINYQREVRAFHIADYINNYDTQEMLDSKLFCQDALNIYEKTTFSTWRVTIDAIERHGAIGRLAVRILQMIAFFDPDDIPRDIFIDLTIDDEPENQNRETFFSRLRRLFVRQKESLPLIPVEKTVISAVRLLVKYSMVDSHKQQSVLNVHRLVQKVIKLEIENSRHGVRPILRDCLSLIPDLTMNRKNHTNHSHAVSIALSALQFNDLVEEFSEVPNEILIALIDSGKYNRAKEFGDKILQNLTDAIGEDHPDILLTKHNIADAYVQLGKHTEALQIYQEVLEKEKIVLGEGHPYTLHTKHNIACTYRQLGKHTEALQIYQEVLEKRKNVLGEDHPDTLHTKHNIAYTHGQLGKHTEELQIYQEVLEKQKNVLGEDYPGTLHTKHNIADAYGQLGKYTEALQIYEEVLEKRKNVLGEDHPYTLITKHSIGLTCGELGKHTEALQIYQEVLEKQKNVLGEDHPDTLSTKHNIGYTYEQLGKHTEALQIYEKVLEKRKNVLGEDHPDTLHTKHNIAYTHGQLGKHTEALRIYQEVLERQKNVLGEDHPDTLNTKHNIGYTYAQLEKETEPSD